MHLAQPCRRRTGERGHVDDDIRVQVPVHVLECIGEHHPALRVGVDDLDRRATVAADHVPGTVRVGADGVLGEREHGDDLVGQLGLGRGEHCREHDRRPGHVRLHRDHRVPRLDGQTAGVEGDSLSDQGDPHRVRSPVRGPVPHRHQPRSGG